MSFNADEFLETFSPYYVKTLGYDTKISLKQGAQRKQIIAQEINSNIFGLFQFSIEFNNFDIEL